MPEISIKNPHLWSSEGGIKFAGRLHYQGKLYNTTETFTLFDKVQNPSQLSDILLDVHGEFTVIIQNNGELFFGHAPNGAAVPLFHTNKNGGLISDNYYEIEDRAGPQRWKPIYGVELLSRGEIWGEKTIHPDIYKITRGMFVVFDFENSSFESQRYYRIHQAENNDQQQIFDELLSVLDSIFERLNQRVNGKPVLLGLSGGYDSRLLALMLNRHEFDRVFTYTVNTQSSYDQDIAEKLANQLGFEWTPIEHTHEKIQAMYKSDTWWDVEELAGGYGKHCPNPSSLVTYSELSQNENLPNDGVRLSGLTPADGVHIPRFMTESGKVTVDEIAKYIVEDECSNMPIEDGTTEMLATRVEDWISFDKPINNSTAINILTNFYIHKHHFGRSGLISDYFGYEDHRPFQDPDFLEFYSSLSIEQKYNRNYLESFTEQLNEKYAPTVPIGRPSEMNDKSHIKQNLKSVIIGSPFESPARFLNQLLTTDSPRDEYEIKYGFLSETVFDEIHTEGCHYRYYLARDALSQSASGPTDDSAHFV